FPEEPVVLILFFVLVVRVRAKFRESQMVFQKILGRTLEERPDMRRGKDVPMPFSGNRRDQDLPRSSGRRPGLNRPGCGASFMRRTAYDVGRNARHPGGGAV